MTTQRLYEPGSDLEIPGLEAIMEYGDASKLRADRIPGAMLINDQSKLDRVRITQLDGLHDEPDGSESRQSNSDRHGESAGQMLYRGRTIGMTGRVEAGNIGAMRDLWRRFRSQFGTHERDLVIHHPLEVVALTNQTINPRVDIDSVGWLTPLTTGGGTPSLTPATFVALTKAGQADLASATGAGQLRIYGDPRYYARWRGEDIWVTARLRPTISGIVNFMSVGVVQFTNVTTSSPGVGTYTILGAIIPNTVASPVTNQWVTFSQRILASSLLPRTTYVTPAIVLSFTTGGTYAIAFTDVGMVFLDQGQATPEAYFDETTPGFVSTGLPRRSPSMGPSRVINRITDATLENYDPTTMAVEDWAWYGTGVTSNQDPIRTDTWKGDYVPASVYAKSTKDATTTSRTMGIVAVDNTQANFYYRVVGNRRYRFGCKVKTLQLPPTGALRATIIWYDINGGVITTNVSETLILGVNDAVVEIDAPLGAYYAQCAVRNTTVTTASAVLEFYVSDAYFIDVTDTDSGPFFGLGDPSKEVKNQRRAPRPFLVRKVRKTPGDMKAPEQQTRSRAWRDFSMSLRASDPRVYSIDAQRRGYTIPPASALKLLTATGSAFPKTDVGKTTVVSATFNGVNSGVDSLAGHVSTTGGTWSLTGPLAWKLVDTGDGWMTVPDAAVDNDGWALAGATNYGDVEVVSLINTRYFGSGFDDNNSASVFARYVDSNNYLRAEITLLPTLRLVKVVSGVETVLASASLSSSLQATWLKLRLIVNAAGKIVVFCENINSTQRFKDLYATDSAFATGGALDTGKVGLAKKNTGNVVGVQSYFDDFRAYSPSDPKTAREPTGFAYEGENLPYETAWTRSVQAPDLTLGSTLIRNSGVRIKTWPDVGTSSTIERPSSPIVARFYTDQSYSYASPAVIANCGPHAYLPPPPGPTLQMDSGWTIIGHTPYTNAATILLKRVSSTTWLELRWNVLSHAYALKKDPSVVNAPYAFELWCSHNTSGTLTTTRLAQWDYDIDGFNPATSTFSFDPLNEDRYLFVYMLNNVVTWELWSRYPGSVTIRANEDFLLQRQTWNVPAGLQSVIGSSVAGRPGFAMKIDNPSSGSGWLATTRNAPYLSYLEISDASVAPDPIECPVIGGVDTPQKLVLSGVTNPLISMAVPDADGVLNSYLVAMDGEVESDNAVTINLDDGSITDANGNNRYGMLEPGSQLPMFQPGMNYVTIAANAWDTTAPEHISVHWRDALG